MRQRSEMVFRKQQRVREKLEKEGAEKRRRRRRRGEGEREEVNQSPKAEACYRPGWCVYTVIETPIPLHFLARSLLHISLVPTRLFSRSVPRVILLFASPFSSTGSQCANAAPENQQRDHSCRFHLTRCERAGLLQGNRVTQVCVCVCVSTNHSSRKACRHHF